MAEFHSNSSHVLLFPFMAHGHLNPSIAFATLLEQRNPYTITIISTPLNILTVQSRFPPSSTIRFASLPFNPSDYGLPPDAENTNTLHLHLIPILIQASASLQPVFERFVFDTIHRDGFPPLCIISDQFLPWSVEVAKKLGVFHCVLDTSGAYGTAVYISIGIHLPHNQTDTDEFPVPGFPDMYLHRSQLTEECKNADGTDPWSVFLKKQLELTSRSDAILVNTVEELERTALDHLRKNLWKRVWAVGPLLCRPLRSSPSSLSCIQWLNLHPPRTVLYFSFGSQYSISSTQMMELAKGLEVCGTDFIWVVRPPIGFDVKDDLRVEWLPDGFEDRMVEKKQGILMRNWGPQMDILSHRSTGAFLSHCGWNSTLESLSYGVPMIGWPMEAEQFYNSKMLMEELGVAVEMARGCEAEIGGGHVARVVRLVMDGESEKGVEMRRNAQRIAEVLKEANVREERCKGSSYKAMEEFIQMAVSSKTNS